MIKQQLAGLVTHGIEQAQAAGILPAFAIPAFSIDPAQRVEHGDYSCSVAMKLASVAKRPPLQIAQAIAAQIPATELVSNSQAVAPGFINFTLNPIWIARQTGAILDAGDHYPRLGIGEGQRVQVEHVSANPTGPLTVGSARNAAIGDTLARTLAAAGYAVEREYYINDAGSQVRHFGESVYARYRQALGQAEPFPEDGYKGAYIADIADSIITREGNKYLEMPKEQAIRAVGRIGIDAMLADIRETLNLMNVEFDTWFSEASLYSSGLFNRVFKMLEDKGLTLDSEDATWFAATQLGLEKDAVLIRSAKVIPNPDERPTYLASDAAYVWNKLAERKFDKAIYVWGADHHGDVARVLALTRALGLDVTRAVILIYQLVTLKRNGEPVRMSKRSGEFITLREVLEEVGSDAVRFMLITRSADSTMDFDLGLVKQQSEDNPVYYVQYAHARIVSILRIARERGFTEEGGDVGRLTHPSERALILKMIRMEEVVEIVSSRLEPHHLAHYALELASAFTKFYDDCRVLPSEMQPVEPETTRARLLLVRAAKQVLARTLSLMGVTAPESM